MDKMQLFVKENRHIAMQSEAFLKMFNVVAVFAPRHASDYLGPRKIRRAAIAPDVFDDSIARFEPFGAKSPRQTPSR
jgi:hypothetical protein